MCIPVAAGMLIATMASAAMSGVSAYQSARGQKAALNAQAQVDERNATLNDQESRRAADKAVRDQEAMGIRQNDLRGRQTAALAANGLDLSSTTPQAIVDQTDYYGLQDQMTASQNALDTDAAYRNRSAELRAHGSFSSGGAKAINPWMSAGGSLLSSAGKVASSWYNYSGGGG